MLESYRPQKTFLLPEATREHLQRVGRTASADQPAGTHARLILQRLLIDLAWNSSRLEGNTYSLLDTERLFQARSSAEPHTVLETQMLLNHKQAIEYLVDDAASLAIEPRTIRTLHGLLAENLLSDPADEGRLRQMPVGIHDSVYVPLAMPQRLEELFVHLLRTAAAITDPFEQSFFLLVHLPYLQPFSDVNKRVSRLAANIPLLRHNLQPLSFVDLPQDAYTQATLVLYELRRIEPLREVFVWAYQRSADRYRVIRQSLGEPDAFRLRYRDQLHRAVSQVVQSVASTGSGGISALMEDLATMAQPGERAGYLALLHQELRNLNEGTFHRYGLRPSEFDAWVQARPSLLDAISEAPREETAPQGRRRSPSQRPTSD